MIKYAGKVHEHFKMVCYPFRQDLKEYLIIQKDVLGVSDPLLLAEWLGFSKQKLLTLLHANISTTLHNILHHEELNGVRDDKNEEAFIQVQLDVIQVRQMGFPHFWIHIIFGNLQNLCNINPTPLVSPKCLNAPIQISKTVSYTLKIAVQRLCCDELHSFIQRWVSSCYIFLFYKLVQN